MVLNLAFMIVCSMSIYYDYFKKIIFSKYTQKQWIQIGDCTVFSTYSY